MKTIEEIMDASRDAADIIKDLQQKTISVPAWSVLENEYNKKKHPVYTDGNYVDTGKVKLTRVGLGWQKLATKRMGELMFGIPPKRVYKAKNEQEQKAANLLEGIYRKNRIDSVNIERSKYLYASCEFVTIWYSVLDSLTYGGVQSRLKYRCKTYSPMKGDALYPLFDDFGDLIALSVMYGQKVGTDSVQYFEVYTAKEHMRWRQEGNEWVEDMTREPVNIGKIAGVYAHRDEPIWEQESDNVYEAEWELSRNGNYIRKNSKPNWVVKCNKEELDKFKREIDTDTTSRNVLLYPRDSEVGFETWNQSIESLKFQNEALRQNFFRQLQLPDMSFETMKSLPMSGEARKMMFIDAQLKVLDEQGLWLEVLDREMNVVKAFAKFGTPSLEAAIDSLEVEHIITPYRIEDALEKAQIATTLNGNKPVLSQETTMRRYGDVDDVDEEMKQIQKESASALEEVVY